MAKRWTKKEDQYIIKYYETKSVSYIADKLKRTYSAVTVRAHYLKVRKTKQRNIMSSSKDDYRRQLSKLLTQERTEKGICSKCGNKLVSKMYCQKCLNKIKKYNRKYYRKRRES